MIVKVSLYYYQNHLVILYPLVTSSHLESKGNTKNFRCRYSTTTFPFKPGQ